MGKSTTAGQRKLKCVAKLGFHPYFGVNFSIKNDTVNDTIVSFTVSVMAYHTEFDTFSNACLILQRYPSLRCIWGACVAFSLLRCIRNFHRRFKSCSAIDITRYLTQSEWHNTRIMIQWGPGYRKCNANSPSVALPYIALHLRFSVALAEIT